MDESEFQVFEKTLREKLPVTFRINSGEANHARFSEMLRDSKFIESFTDKDHVAEPDQHDSLKTQKIDFSSLCMDCKSYYPGDVLFEMKIPRDLLKKNIGLKQIH